MPWCVPGVVNICQVIAVQTTKLLLSFRRHKMRCTVALGGLLIRIPPTRERLMPAHMCLCVYMYVCAADKCTELRCCHCSKVKPYNMRIMQVHALWGVHFVCVCVCVTHIIALQMNPLCSCLCITSPQWRPPRAPRTKRTG